MSSFPKQARLLIRRTEDQAGFKRTIVGGVVLDDLLEGSEEDEIWDCEITITTRHRRFRCGKGMMGKTLSEAMTSYSFNDPVACGFEEIKGKAS